MYKKVSFILIFSLCGMLSAANEPDTPRLDKPGFFTRIGAFFRKKPVNRVASVSVMTPEEESAKQHVDQRMGLSPSSASAQEYDSVKETAKLEKIFELETKAHRAFKDADDEKINAYRAYQKARDNLDKVSNTDVSEKAKQQAKDAYIKAVARKEAAYNARAKAEVASRRMEKDREAAYRTWLDRGYENRLAKRADLRQAAELEQKTPVGMHPDLGMTVKQRDQRLGEETMTRHVQNWIRTGEGARDLEEARVQAHRKWFEGMENVDEEEQARLTQRRPALEARIYASNDHRVALKKRDNLAKEINRRTKEMQAPLTKEEEKAWDQESKAWLSKPMAEREKTSITTPVYKRMIALENLKETLRKADQEVKDAEIKKAKAKEAWRRVR